MTQQEREGSLVFSLDFELFWGMTDVRPLDEEYQQVLLRSRDAIPAILDLFAQYGIHATWATVGILFYRSRADLLEGAPTKKPSYTDLALSNYDRLATVGEDEANDPYHFGQSLIRRIASTPHQEIGTHTFSHYYCAEPVQDTASFHADMFAATRAASTLGMQLRSVVFPRHQSDGPHLEVCRALGIDIYRGNVPHWAYASLPKDEQTLLKRVIRAADSYVNITGEHTFPLSQICSNGMVNIPSSHYLRPYSRRLKLFEPLKTRRITQAMTSAAQRGEICHLWFHPEEFGYDTEENMHSLEQVLRHYETLRQQYGMKSYTMAEQAGVARA